MEWIMGPWPWWLSGILIGLTVPALYYFAGKAFGVSTSLQHIGAICAPRSSLTYLREHNWSDGIWNLIFVAGVAIGGFVAATWLSTESLAILPEQYFTFPGIIQLFMGGILVGFGTRYAGGCTSGHAITGLSNLNWPSLVATIFFFVGGLIVTWVFGPLLF